MMSDKISMLSDALPVSAKAAAGDALERAPHNAPILCIWVEDGNIKYAKANTTFEFACVVSAFAQSWTNDWMHK
jgi:hypothetical protein